MSFAPVANLFDDTVVALEPEAGGARFNVSALNDPGTLLRILELFAKRGLTPDRVRSDRCDGELMLMIEVDEMEAELAAYIGRCIQEIFVVRSVAVGGQTP
jgi:prephenate dehydratase